MRAIDQERYCRTFGDQVRRVRLERKLTQEDMTELGFSLRHFQRIEAGRSVTLRTLIKLADAFNVRPRDLLPP